MPRVRIASSSGNAMHGVAMQPIELLLQMQIALALTLGLIICRNGA